MRRQSIIIIGVAALLGLLAVFLVNAYLTSNDQRRDAITEATGTRQIAVARIPLEFGAEINSQNIRFVAWPESSVPEGSFSSMEEFGADDLSPVVLRPIQPGEPILRSRLAGEGGRATLSALLPADMLAVAINITPVSGVAGFVLPGDHVDVLLTQSENEEQVTDILLQNIRVIAIDQMANDSSEEPTLGNTATLEVSREDAQKLALAISVGSMSLALRSVRAEEEFVFSTALRGSELSNGAFRYRPPSSVAPDYANAIRRAPRASTAPATSDVEIVRGTSGTDYQVRRQRGN